MYFLVFSYTRHNHEVAYSIVQSSPMTSLRRTHMAHAWDHFVLRLLRCVRFDVSHLSSQNYQRLKNIVRALPVTRAQLALIQNYLPFEKPGSVCLCAAVGYYVVVAEMMSRKEVTSRRTFSQGLHDFPCGSFTLTKS